MKNKIVLLFCCVFLITITAIKAQLPFYNEIQQFKQMDSLKFPQKQAILFVGSSSFTKWTNMQESFPGYLLYNRGFGGSALTDVINYANDIIIPYEPHQIIIYCGENDLANDATVTGKVVFDRFVQLYTLVKQQLPNVSIAYVSMKPSPSRKLLWPKMIAGNALIQTYLATQPNTFFINVWPAMFTPDGNLVSDIFLPDNLHLNAKGYAIWQKIIIPFLIR